jgi:hypothetical protein
MLKPVFFPVKNISAQIKQLLTGVNKFNNMDKATATAAQQNNFGLR